MTETEFNAQLREVLRNQGFSVIHIRETADTPGVLDLLVYMDRIIMCWIELKIENHLVEPSQREFMRNQENLGIPCYVIRHYACTTVPLVDEFVTFFRPHEERFLPIKVENWRTRDWVARLCGTT